MSDHFLLVIPSDPCADAPENTDAVSAALSAICGTNEVRFKNYGKLQFIDCGENFERILCPECGHEFTTPEWHAWMDADWHGEDGFHLHDHKSPCCDKTMKTSDLIYEWPQGFARWFVSARNTGRGPLTPAEVEQLETIAGLKLTAIAQMY